MAAATTAGRFPLPPGEGQGEGNYHYYRRFLSVCTLSYSWFKLLMFDITEVGTFCVKRFPTEMMITV